METYYSILSIPIRPEIQEKLSVGFLLISRDKIFFNISKNKISLLKELMSDSAFKFLKESLRNIEQTAINENDKLQKCNNLLFSEVQSESNYFSQSYLEYISQYNNNLLTFSRPKVIEAPANEKTFKILFEKFVDEYAFIESQEKKKRSIETFKIDYYPKLEPYFNIEREVTFNDIPNLLMPVKVDMMGKNEIEVFAQTVDFEKNPYYIQNDITNLLILKNAIDRAKQFIISKEPNKNFSKQHDIWNNIKKSNLFQYVDLSEAELIEDYAKKNNVKPFVQETSVG
ncbi:MAG: hypothetical protein HY738_00415 [Bacteroidia bacterium]|nr:hypothetical protein [Bacteroidia bacterium]